MPKQYNTNGVAFGQRMQQTYQTLRFFCERSSRHFLSTLSLLRRKVNAGYPDRAQDHL